MSSNDHDSAVEFFSAYFHEDWALDSASTDEAVALFMNSASNADELLSVARGIEELINRWPTDEQLERSLVDEFGCYYLPSAQGGSARKWLQGIAYTLHEKARLRKS
jgi:hypothetical protein